MFAVIETMSYKIFKIMITCCALSLFFFGWFSNDDNSTAKKQEAEVIRQETFTDLDAHKSMTAERAVEIMLENGFMPQLPPAKLPCPLLKVQKKANTPYERINLSESKKPIIIHFWATWCGPCKRELPEFDVFAKTAAKTVDIYTVTSELKDGSNAEAMKIWDFYQTKGIKNLNVTADENNVLAANFGVTGVPVTFLIDKNGRLIGQFLGATDWSKIELVAAILTILK